MISSATLPEGLNYGENVVAHTVGDQAVSDDDVTIEGAGEYVRTNTTYGYDFDRPTAPLYIHIPNLMPEIPKEDHYKTEKRRSDWTKMAVVNSKQCRPKFETKHVMANALTGRKKANEDWDERLTASGIVKDSTKFEMSFMHGRVSDIQYTTSTFNG